eukprot:2747536-Rhodomonas_salina.1
MSPERETARHHTSAKCALNAYTCNALHAFSHRLVRACSYMQSASGLGCGVSANLIWDGVSD